ncbi:MAG TPA: YciI family protein [Polyangiaceae bacterium]|jgi:hypothetical protein|nr:YciI family protein [Polyangiaceae bacterium]
MTDYILFMHDDAPVAASAGVEDTCGPYLAKLRASGHFEGGSGIGGGECVNKGGRNIEISKRLVGFIRVTAENLTQAREFLQGNPVFEAGGTVEIRELPKT